MRACRAFAGCASNRSPCFDSITRASAVATTSLRPRPRVGGQRNRKLVEPGFDRQIERLVPPERDAVRQRNRHRTRRQREPATVVNVAPCVRADARAVSRAAAGPASALTNASEAGIDADTPVVVMTLPSIT